MNLFRFLTRYLNANHLTFLVFAAFLILALPFISFTKATLEIFPDTNKVNKLLKKGMSLHYDDPDSAIFYYQTINSHFQTVEPNIVFEKLNDIDRAYIETVINANNRIGNIHYFNDEYKRAEIYYQKSLKISRRTDMSQFIGKALFDIGYIRYVNNDFTSAKNLFIESYEYYSLAKNKDGIFQVLNACGLSNYHLGKFEASDSCYQEALKLAVILKDSSYISDIKIHMGILYCEQQQLEEGIILFEEALDYYKKMNYKEAVSDVQLNIGVVMKLVGAYDQSEKYIQESLKCEEILQKKSRLVGRYYHLADLYLDINEDEMAFDYCQKTLSVAEEIASKPFIAECNFLMGKYFMHENNYEKADAHFSKALHEAEKSNDITLITNVNLWSSNLAIQQNRFNDAIAFATNAYRSAKELSLFSAQKDASYTLFKIYEIQGENKEALKWFETYHNVYDSINYFQQQKEIKRIEARYNYEQKEQENELLRNKTSLQEIRLKNRTITLLAFGLGIILSIVVIVLLINRIRYNRVLNREQQLLSIQKLENLNNELDVKKRELTSKMMFLNQKNELVERTIVQLKELQNTSDIPYKKINALVNELRTDAPQSNWKEFETQFIQVHPDFYKRLYEKYPELTSYEQRICAFLRMNLNTKEIASITSRTSKSIEVTRSRIRNKLHLSRKDNLSSFLASV